MFVEWNESYAIGVDEIDRQHRELFARFEDLMNAVGSGRGKADLVPLIGFLDAYAATHFHEEEQLHMRHHYPESCFHRDAHAIFLGRLSALKTEVEAKGASNHLVIETGKVLFRWLVDHVCGMDRQFGDFLRTGVEEA
ncbi:MAG: hemerythrin family protein [Desulfuromonadales bacterium]|nr:MAG: hemerythrin family protein [Desulfuromonadales bacterium]